MSELKKDEINWEENAWFVKYHLPHCTDEFKQAWVGHYGKPSDYSDSDDPAEYWIRCAFFLFGWIAHQKHLIEITPTS